jgi:hypothetical protein
MTVRTAIRQRVPPNVLPEFTPVPRKVQRHDGWTPERQRAFIAALADTGCVAIAARMVNMSPESAYQLRRRPGAESFRAAWDAAQSLGLLAVKDEAFDRAMNGEVIPVFVGGKLMGFRRKKNDRLLMFILRHYGQDAGGRKVTINYFSSRATAGAAAPGGRQPAAGAAGPGRPATGEAASIGVADPRRDDAVSLAQASTTTVKTVISGTDAPTQLAADDEAAAILNAFEGVALDAEAQAEIHRALTACAERRRALQDDPEHDPERFYIGAREAGAYLGQLESGVEGDWIDRHPEGWQRPDGEHLWENLGAGGEAERIDEVLAGMAERPAERTPEEIAAEQAEDEAEARRRREAREARESPALPKPEPDPPALSEVEGDDPRLDWSNWTSGGYVPPLPTPAHPEHEPVPAKARKGPVRAEAEVPISPRTGKPLRRYKERRPKPPFAPLVPSEGEVAYEARKTEAAAAVKANRRELADAEADRRKRRKAGVRQA